MTGVLDRAFANTYVPPQGALAPPPAQGVMPPQAPQAPPDYPGASQIEALMSQTSDKASTAFMRAHPVSSRLQMLAAAMGGGPTAMEQLRQTFAARQMEPLQVAQQRAAFAGIQGLFGQLSPQMKNLLLVDPTTAIKILQARQEPQPTAGGASQVTMGGDGERSSVVTAPLLANNPQSGQTYTQNANAPTVYGGAVPTVQDLAAGHKISGLAPVGTPAVGAGDGENASSGLPPSLTSDAADKYLSPDQAAGRGAPAGFGMTVHADGSTTLIPPNVTETDFHGLGAKYLADPNHQFAVARTTALSGLGSSLENLPPSAMQSQQALNAYLGSITRANQPRPSTLEDFVKTMGVSDELHRYLTGAMPGGLGQTISPAALKQLYRTGYLATEPVAKTDQQLLAPVTSVAQRYKYDPTPYVSNAARMPDVPRSMQDGQPPMNARKQGIVVWSPKGPVRWNGKGWDPL